ncbi:DUF4926 domain-containing protein [Leptolyngbya sp. AN02str]|uniref:DUF4926 domain-containing protein n=1 Tax=Leptolyngbya sp. AN02str TaxID=3423363 RepID=UPI003D31AAE9
MVNTLSTLQLLDVVALMDELPQYRLQIGQVGTIVEHLATDVYEVDFSDDDGQTYAMLPLHASQLMKLHYAPRFNPSTERQESNSMSDSIHQYQYGSGDNVAGDKVMGDKVTGHKAQVTNNLQNANIANFANEVKDNATQNAEQFSQMSGTSTAELLQLIATLRQSTAQFPAEVQEDLAIELADVEEEVKKPADQRNTPRLKKRLMALITAASLVASGVAGANEFVDNVIELGSKVGIELPLPTP